MIILLIAAALAGVCAALSHAYRAGLFKKLTVELHFSADGVFEGERARVTETVTNKKLLPVFWGSVRFKTPHALCFDGTAIDHDYYRSDPLCVFSYEQVKKHLYFTAEKRGYYILRDGSVAGGDLLYSFRLTHSFPASCALYVYPCVRDEKRFPIDFHRLMGEVIARRRLIEDPLCFRGIRDYVPTDGMKAINWNATARTGALKVNEYHSTSAQEAVLLVDLDRFNDFDGDAIKEDVIRIAAILAKELLKAGIATGLVTNAASVRTGEAIRTACKSGQGHYIELLRQLACIDTERLCAPFGRVLDTLGTNDGTAPQYILISYHYSPQLAGRISRLEARGLRFLWILQKDETRRLEIAPRSNLYVSEVMY